MPSELPAHVEWLLPRIGNRLEAEVRRQGGADDARTVLAKLCQADPSPGKIAVQWLGERLLDGGFLWEDARAGLGSKAYETLVAFGTHRRTLSEPERNLAAHATLVSAWKAVAHLMPREDEDAEEPGIRERRRRERADAHAESIILCERPGLTVAVPMTEYASQWWGRGTRWCTAADNDNAFDEYNDNGPLIVVLLPGEKLQMFLNREREKVDFMNAVDERVGIEIIERHWDTVGPLVAWAVGQMGSMLEFVPMALRDREMCLVAVAQMGSVLELVPMALRDREMCLVAVRQSALALNHVPIEILDRTMYLAAVEMDGFAIRFVPPALRDWELCSAAVSQCGGALKYTPEVFQTLDMCIDAMTRDGLALENVAPAMQVEPVFLAAVSQNGAALRLVPSELRNQQLCLTAVEQNGWSLCHVPEALRKREIYMAAVNQNEFVIRLVPEPLRDREMYLAAVTHDGSLLHLVPKALQDSEMRLAASGQNTSALRPMPGLLSWSPEEALRGLSEALNATAPEARFP